MCTVEFELLLFLKSHEMRTASKTYFFLDKAYINYSARKGGHFDTPLHSWRSWGKHENSTKKKFYKESEVEKFLIDFFFMFYIVLKILVKKI